MHDWSEGSPSYSLKFDMKDGRSFSVGTTWSRPEIEALKSQVASFLGRIEQDGLPGADPWTARTGEDHE